MRVGGEIVFNSAWNLLFFLLILSYFKVYINQMQNPETPFQPETKLKQLGLIWGPSRAEEPGLDRRSG